MGRIQNGYLYEASGAFFVRYYARKIVDGKLQRVQSSHRLCSKDAKHYALNARAVKLLRDEFMLSVNKQKSSGSNVQQDMDIIAFWEQRYLPYCEEVLPLTGEPRKKPSTVRGYRQIWKQHLQAHFTAVTLQEYEPAMGVQFLQSLTGTQGKTTLKHIKALGGSLFKRAVIEKRLKVNPFHDVEMPEDAIESKRTKHYTMAQSEDMISALVDRVDCQLILALSCFMGLRPSEANAVKWEDFDTDWLHIRRGIVNGIVGTPKTLESVASVPLMVQVRVPLELWRLKCGNPTSGWVFPSSTDRTDKPADFHNLINRVIKPTLKSAGIDYFTGLYAGRRAAATAIIELTNNPSIAQSLLRHKSLKTTLDFYNQGLSSQEFKDGMHLFEQKALGTKSEAKN